MNKIITPENISIANNPNINEKMIQQIIANDPSVLNLGNLVLKDRERIQPRAGRLDLLFQDIDTSRRYEVELQLGKADESHIIRTVEYWDIERKRYPQYEHCAVIIAEDITSRFLNVIGLFNGNIPIIAIQMKAFKVGDDIALNFTTVLDELNLGMVDDDESSGEVADRDYWIKRGTKETVGMADDLLDYINEVTNEKYELKYNKFYIGLIHSGQPNNFIVFRPRKSSLNAEFRGPYNENIQELISKAELDDMGYLKKWNVFRIRLEKDDIKKHKDVLMKLIEFSYKS